MRPPSPLPSKRFAAGALAAVLAGGAAHAAPTAFDQPGLQAPETLRVALPSVVDGGVLPTNYAADGRNLSPPLSWSAGPPGTVGYAVVAQDADAQGPSVHWVAYGVAPTALPRGVRNRTVPAHPLGMMQGPNDHGGVGYTGAQPQPAGAPPHHYHFEVFALNRALRLPPGAPLARLEQAMAGHVVARGQIVLTYPPPPHAPRSGDAPAGPGGPAEGAAGPAPGAPP